MELRTRTSFRLAPISLRDANAFVATHHRHHKPVRGHRYSLAAWHDGHLAGVVIVGRPVARLAGDPLQVLEVTRLCTDGTYNCCSFLYAAAARAGKALGYQKIQTYILSTEPGTSLAAAGWSFEARTYGRQWQHTDGKERRTDQPNIDKLRWAKSLQ